MGKAKIKNGYSSYFLSKYCFITYTFKIKEKYFKLFQRIRFSVSTYDFNQIHKKLKNRCDVDFNVLITPLINIKHICLIPVIII